MKVLLGITGGIAAYKTPELVRMFVKNGHEVKTILTDNAKYFVTPQTLETVSNNRCYDDLFSRARDIEHISLTDWADVMVIAPATANTIGKICGGVCDDLLTTIILALDKPCFVFPSMNAKMLDHPAVCENINKLEGWGYFVCEPESGELACGTSGKGRLPDVKLIYEVVTSGMEKLITKQTLNSKNVIVTAGSTKAYIDPVRYIENGSSGTMGVELTKQAWLRGANVTLVCNKDVVEKFPESKYYAERIILCETTEDVLKNITEIFNDADIYISAAALCDFKNEPKKDKIKKGTGEIVLKLKPSVDVFSALSSKKTGQLMVGFALESSDMEKNAIKKLKSKYMDIIVANPVKAMGSRTSEVTIINRNGTKRRIKKAEKRIIAAEVLKEIEKLAATKATRARESASSKVRKANEAYTNESYIEN
ncbi:MAG: bifunctional phosphopantothenoylcysteine decarboxylase/phosphopantothenate--cysteine ligase CoaBC [Pseudomonadota bacterium]